MRQDFIEKIINQRTPIAEKFDSSRKRLSQILEKLDEFFTLCKKYSNDVADTDSLAGLFSVTNAFEHIINEGNLLMADLHNISARLSRKTLNIAVIGRARQGKSRLLQTITGLTSTEIPDGNLAYCTGVRSDIINDVTAAESYAVVNFLTERRFIKENVAPYFQELQKCIPNLSAPDSVAEFRRLELPKPGTFEARPEEITQMNVNLENLKGIQEHLSDYVEYLDKAPIRINREQIREYVAHDDEKGNPVYFKHYAVDKVEIFCKFPNTEVKDLRLIDLPGLGDTRIGDIERLVSALSDQVDLVVFLSKPSNTGAAWQDNEIHLYSQAKRALGEKLPIERWSFWAFNHDSRPGAENLPQCELMQKSMSSAQIKVSDSVIADCTNLDEVSSNLIDKALNYLASNIERNDLEYASNIKEFLNKLMSDIQNVVNSAGRFLRENNDFDKDSYKFDVLFKKDIWNKLREEIQAAVGVESDIRIKRDDDCKPFKDRIEEILKSEEAADPAVTYTDFIKRAANRAGGLQTAYEQAMHQLRTRLGARLQEDLDDILNEVLIEMKNKICAILANTGRLELVFGVKDNKLLNCIVEFIENSDFKNDVHTLAAGFNLLNNWSMNYRSFIQHRLRSSLNRLDPLDRASSEYGNPSDVEECVTLLSALYHETINAINRAFADIYSEPNKAAFAVAEEFKDIVLRSSADDDIGLEIEWRTFYRSIRGSVWPEEYGASQKQHEMRTKLSAPINEINTMLDAADFNF